MAPRQYICFPVSQGVHLDPLWIGRSPAPTHLPST